MATPNTWAWLHVKLAGTSYTRPELGAYTPQTLLLRLRDWARREQNVYTDRYQEARDDLAYQGYTADEITEALEQEWEDALLADALMQFLDNLQIVDEGQAIPHGEATR